MPRPRLEPKDPRDLNDERMRAVAELLDRRDDLRGVSARADLVDENLRWTA